MYFRYIFFPHLFTDQVGRIRSCEKKKPSFRLFLAFLLVRLFGTGYILGWTFAKKAAVCNRSLIPPFTHAIFSVTMCRLSWSPHLIQHRKKRENTIHCRRAHYKLACSAGVFWVRETLFVFVILL